MAARPKFAELIFRADGGPKHPLTKYAVVSDYTDNGERHVFLKLQEPVQVTAPAPKRRKRTTKVAPSKQTAFEPQELV